MILASSMQTPVVVVGLLPVGTPDSLPYPAALFVRLDLALADAHPKLGPLTSSDADTRVLHGVALLKHRRPHRPRDVAYNDESVAFGSRAHVSSAVGLLRVPCARRAVAPHVGRRA